MGIVTEARISNFISFLMTISRANSQKSLCIVTTNCDQNYYFNHNDSDNMQCMGNGCLTVDFRATAF